MPAAGLLEQWSARFFERRLGNHDVWVWIRRARVVHSLHLRADRGILRLGGRDVHRRADSHQRKEFRRSLALQPNTTVGARSGMDEALVKAVRRSELAPVPHRVADVTATSAASGRNNSIALHAEAVRSRTLVLLFGIDCEIAFWCRLNRHTNRNGGRHQAAIAFHYINIFLGKRDFHAHGRRIMRFVLLVAADYGAPRRCSSEEHQSTRRIMSRPTRRGVAGKDFR